MSEAPSGGRVTFEETTLEGVFIIGLEPIDDERGFFARSWCAREFAGHGLQMDFVQENVGYSTHSGTLRGLHFQEPPFAEAKLVRCTAGAVWDVAVDLRPESSTYRNFVGMELSANERMMLYACEGCAHGYLSLTDGAEVRYMTSQFYKPQAASGVRYDDPAVSIDWPSEVRIVSDRDRSWPLLDVSLRHEKVR